VQKQKSQPHETTTTTTTTQQGKKNLEDSANTHTLSSSLFFFSLPIGNKYPASATLTGGRGGGGGGWAGRGFSADVPNLPLYALWMNKRRMSHDFNDIHP